jgi:hypothetical protein
MIQRQCRAGKKSITGSDVALGAIRRHNVYPLSPANFATGYGAFSTVQARLTRADALDLAGNPNGPTPGPQD